MKTKKYDDDRNDVVTHYQRHAANPLVPIRDDETVPDKNKASNLPHRLRFSLTDETIVAEVTLDQEIVIGRRARSSDPAVAVDLEGFDGHQQGVSRVHAMVAVLRDEIIVQDLQSINGTHINGQRLIPLKKYPLRNGVELAVSSLKLIITYIHD
jgi:pSer/pThr/pTyr-binding forkhead associated (FHA) protein